MATRIEVQGRDTKAGDVEEVLATSGVGIEAGDGVVAKAAAEHEGIRPGPAIHDVPSEPTDKDVVTRATDKRVDAEAAP